MAANINRYDDPGRAVPSGQSVPRAPVPVAYGAEGRSAQAGRRISATPRAGQVGSVQSATQAVPGAASAFTLLELLAVLAIIGLVAAMAMPIMRNFRPNYTASATRQLLDDLGYARQLAISHHTTVLMVFVQPNFWNDPATAKWGAPDWAAATNLMEKQMVGYRMVSLRSLGDQPGNHTPRYLTEWKTLPEGAYIAWQKFAGPAAPPLLLLTNGTSVAYPAFGFDRTCSAPFPLLDTPMYNPNPNQQHYAWLSYIAFDYLGRRCNDSGNPIPKDALIPLTRGSIAFAHDPAAKLPLAALPNLSEDPPGNTTNAFNLVYVDWLTGRARGIQQEVQ
jgi:prepilin-type N-terminal cleavage/methylation domain-containing protein